MENVLVGLPLGGVYARSSQDRNGRPSSSSPKTPGPKTVKPGVT